MKKIIFLLLLTTLSLNIFSQINMQDSTVQVIGYWDLNESYSYQITEEKYKISEQDTTKREFLKYNVDLTVLDSTANSYLVEWHYHDYEFQSDNEIMKKMASITNDMKIIVKTDELGAVIEVVNWKDIRKLVYKGTSMLKKELKDIPNMDKVINQIKNMFSSKEIIEAAAIQEIKQFYTYHGGKYKLGEEIKAQIKSPNIYGKEPFDTDVTLWLDEINVENNNYVIRMQQSIDKEQLAKATFGYVSKMASTISGQKVTIEDFENINNTIWTASRIHGTGWTTYSVETKEVSVQDKISFEERIIEML